MIYLCTAEVGGSILLGSTLKRVTPIINRCLTVPSGISTYSQNEFCLLPSHAISLFLPHRGYHELTTAGYINRSNLTFCSPSASRARNLRLSCCVLWERHQKVVYVARAVDEEVYRPELFFGAGAQGSYLPTVGDVGGDDDAPHRPAVLPLEPGPHLEEGVAAVRGQRDVGAFVREGLGHRRADPARSPGHHRHPIPHGSLAHAGLRRSPESAGGTSTQPCFAKYRAYLPRSAASITGRSRPLPSRARRVLRSS